MSFLRGQDAWRRHPVFSWGWKQALPGIREGTALFALWLAYDTFSHRKGGHGHDGAGHDAGHGAAGHGEAGHGAGGAVAAAHHH